MAEPLGQQAGRQLAIVLGTRPEIIKLSPIVRACQRRGIAFYILHSGQHYSPELDRVFFDQLELPAPAYNLQIGSATHGEQTARCLAGVEKVLLAHRPAAVVVQGDTNTVLAATLAASKLGIPVAHVEAGLRSYDRSMPEEINRIVADQLSDYLFAPTAEAADTLRGEGLSSSRIFVTGNTIVDAVEQNLPQARRSSDVLRRLGLTPRGYLLATIHRQENVDHAERFAAILDGLRAVAAECRLPVVYPIHPRARHTLETFGLDAQGLTLCEPVSFFDFLVLEADARLILTDSGGVQEEACILGVPCITLRDNTERVDTLRIGANELVGVDRDRLLAACRRQLNPRAAWQQPYGDGHAANRIAQILAETAAV